MHGGKEICQLIQQHRAIAASFANGTYTPLARVDGDKAYQDLMYWIVVNEGNFGHDEVVSTRVILHEMLRSLKDLGSQRLGQTIQAASVTLPCHNRVHHDRESSVEHIMRDAFSAAELEFLKIVRWPRAGEPLLFVENSQLAGRGLQLCQPYTTTNQSCELDLPTEIYLMLGYYGNALEITETGPIEIAYESWFTPRPAWNLGANVKQRDAFYWKEVRHELIRVVTFFRRNRNITRVLTYGDHGEDAKLREVIADVLQDTGHSPKWIINKVNGTFSGAFGAAEFSKRQPYYSGKGGWLAAAEDVRPFAGDQQVIA